MKTKWLDFSHLNTKLIRYLYGVASISLGEVIAGAVSLWLVARSHGCNDLDNFWIFFVVVFCFGVVIALLGILEPLDI